MNKLIRAVAALKAARIIGHPDTPTVRNWTHEMAADYLTKAYLAGAAHMDRWHRKQTRLPVAEPVPCCPDCGTHLNPSRKYPGKMFCPRGDCGTLYVPVRS